MVKGFPTFRTGNEVPSVWAGFDPEGKRRRGLRILPKEGGYYVHVISRIVGREFLLGEREKKRFHWLMRRIAEFSGLQVVTYCLMDNHFHILLEVPERVELSYGEVLNRLGRIWSEEKIESFAKGYERYADDPAMQRAYLASVTDRMFDLPEYMRLLKLQFTRWYNREHNRKGALWESRYRSVVIEASVSALTTVSTYIDLNPVRAGMVEDPKDYRWSGYGEAVAGRKAARKGLKHLTTEIGGAVPSLYKWENHGKEVVAAFTPGEPPQTWSGVQGLYRCWLFAKGWENPCARKRSKRGFSTEVMGAAMAEGGKLSQVSLAKAQVKYLTSGVAIGSESFLKDLMESHRSCFGKTRTKGGSSMGRAWDGLRAMRDVGG